MNDNDPDKAKEAVQTEAENQEHRAGLIGRLEQAVILLENDHPSLAAALEEAINILAKSGV